MVFLRTLFFLFAAILVLENPSVSSPARIQDIFVGNGSPGPYRLTWKNIAANTELVKVDSLEQVRGLDYMVDPNAGTITFVKAVPTSAALLITYDYETTLAHRNSDGLTLPLMMSIAHTENTSLSLNAIYRNQNGLSSETQAGAQSLSVGLGGEWHGSNNSQLTTHWLYAPTLGTSQADPNRHSGFNDRMGLSVAGGTNAGQKMRLSFGFTKAGLDIGSAASDNGMTVGTQIITLGTQITPSRQVAAEIGFTQTDQTGSANTKSTRESIGVTVTPSAALSVQTHLVNEKTASGTDTTQTDISLRSQVTSKATVAASYAQTQTNTNNNTNTINLSAAVTPSANLNVQTHFVDQKAANGTSTTQSDVSVKSQVTSTTMVGASYAQTQTNTNNNTNTINLSAAITPNQKIALNAAATQSQQGGNTTATQQVNLSITPNKSVHLDSGVSLQQQPQSQSSLMVASVGSTLQPTSFLKVSAAYQHRTATGTDISVLNTTDGSSAQVTVTPFSKLQLTGTYAQNPEQNGQLTQRSAQRGLGCETAFGSFTVKGGYDWMRSYDTPDVSTQLHVDLGLNLAAGTQLTGGYRQTLSGVGLTPAGIEQYSVGFRRDLGERFLLAVNGNLQHQAGNTAVTAADYSATANLGMKF